MISLQFSWITTGQHASRKNCQRTGSKVSFFLDLILAHLWEYVRESEVVLKPLLLVCSPLLSLREGPTFGL